MTSKKTHIDQQQFLQLLEEKVSNIFQAYADGKDVPPAENFRTEGFIEAGCQLGIISEQEAREKIAESYSAILGQDFPEQYNKGIKIPSAMKRAPVFPTTT